MGRRRDQCVIGGAASYAVFDQLEHEGPVSLCIKPQEGLWKPQAQEIPNNGGWTPMRGWKAREHRVRLERTVVDQSNSGIECAPRAFVLRVPGGKRGDD